MLDVVAEYRDPVMLAMLVDREARAWKIRIGKGSERHGDDAWPAFDYISDGRSAIGAEAIGGAMTAVGDALPCLRLARDGDLVVGPARLHRKGAAGALLAIQAVAHRNAHRLAFACGLELAAPAARRPDRIGHGSFSPLV